MAGDDDRRWPGAEAILGATAGIAREIVLASLTSAPAAPPPDRQRRPPDPDPPPERPPERRRVEGGQRRQLTAAPPRAELPRSPQGPKDRAADAVARAEGRGKRTTPAPARPPHVAVRRRDSLRRAARRVGGPYWGMRFMFALISALMLLTVAGFAFERLTGLDVLPNGPAARFWPAPRDFPVLARSTPVSIRAGSVQIDAPIVPVGNTRSGSIDVPHGDRIDDAGWYNKGPTPGEYGPAVIVGHVDSGSGPSVFAKLSRLRPGNRVEVTRADHKVAVFEVNTVKRFDRENLPADQVFGDFSRPALRLITCGGRWVGGTTGYADNVVVFASLVKSRD